MLEQRLATQGLTGKPAATPEAVVERILAVQAQDSRGARLAIRARSRGFGVEAVEAALNSKALVVNWLNRGTLHLVRAEDHAWLHALTAPRQLTASARRLKEEGVSPAQLERGLATLRKVLAADGPQTRRQLRDHLDSADVPTAGQAFFHLLGAASLRGLILRGPMLGDEQAFVLTEDWLGSAAPVEPETALAELARRYLAGHGPACERDLAKWAGITLGQARRGFEAIAKEMIERPQGQFNLAGCKPPRPRHTLPPPRLLGPFDPVLHGWADRSFLIPAGRDRGVVTLNGIFRPTILIEGQVAGTWSMPGGEINLSPFEPLDPEAARALARDAEAMRRYIES